MFEKEPEEAAQIQLYKKLFEVSKELGSITKNKENPFFKAGYADLEAYLDTIKPILNKHNLLLLQPIENMNVVTRIIDIDSGASVDSSIKLPESNDPQKTGAATTYFKRFSIGALLALSETDDDGNLAAGVHETKAATVSVPVYEEEYNQTPREVPNSILNALPDRTSISPDYMIDFGKYKGKKIGTIGREPLQGYLSWLKGTKDSPPLTGKAKVFFEKATAYLKSSGNN